MVKFIRYIFYCSLACAAAQAQTGPSPGRLQGTVWADGKPLPFASIGFTDIKTGAVTNEAGVYELQHIPPGRHQVQVSAVGFVKHVQAIQVKASGTARLDITLQATSSSLSEVVVT